MLKLKGEGGGSGNQNEIVFSIVMILCMHREVKKCLIPFLFFMLICFSNYIINNKCLCTVASIILTTQV